MAVIQINNLSFSYPGALLPVFENINLNLDSSWRLGLIGRNGRGKTTLLKLLTGDLNGQGSIITEESFDYFPCYPQNDNISVMRALKAIIAPFEEWEEKMQQLALIADEKAMQEYAEVQSQYENAGGYNIEEMLLAEASRLKVSSSVFQRSFRTLSGGEKVKLLLAAIFLKKHSFLLIDEPTDHLDTEGRKTVAAWLAQKSGFIIVSHDRAFLDEAIDHVLSINKAGIELQKGNYSSWRQNRTIQDNFELAQNKKLKANIKQLEEAAQRTEKWSDKVEKSKTSGNADQSKGTGKIDRGYIGARAAAMMKTSKAIEVRRGAQIEEKKGLLKNIEENETLKFIILPAAKSCFITAENIGLSFKGRTIFENVSFSLNEGERLAIKGANGSGKTCLINLILDMAKKRNKEQNIFEHNSLEILEKQFNFTGNISLFSQLKVSYLSQDTAHLKGGIKEFSSMRQIDESLLLAILRKLDFKRESFLQPIESYSAGQKKKLCLAASMATPANLFIWDEPLNYIDVLSREQIENTVIKFCPTMLFVEHDATFVDKASTKQIQL